LFLGEEGLTLKNLDIILFAYPRGVWKSLFHCSRSKDLWVMSEWLNMIDLSSLISSWVYSEERRYKKNLTHHWIILFMVNTTVQIPTLYIIAFVNYSSFCNLFSLYLLYKSIFLLLLLWRVTLFSIQGWNHTFVINQEFQKCDIMLGFCRSGDNHLTKEFL